MASPRQANLRVRLPWLLSVLACWRLMASPRRATVQVCLCWFLSWRFRLRRRYNVFTLFYIVIHCITQPSIISCNLGSVRPRPIHPICPICSAERKRQKRNGVPPMFRS